jgi:hypothetical protein
MEQSWIYAFGDDMYSILGEPVIQKNAAPPVGRYPDFIEFPENAEFLAGHNGGFPNDEADAAAP